MKTRSPLLLTLTELIVMLLVFSLCAVVCLELFSSARTMTRDSQDLTQACDWAQAAASAYKAADGDPAAAAALLEAQTTADGFCLIYEEGARVVLTESEPGTARVAAGPQDAEPLVTFTVKAVGP